MYLYVTTAKWYSWKWQFMMIQWIQLNSFDNDAAPSLCHLIHIQSRCSCFIPHIISIQLYRQFQLCFFFLSHFFCERTSHVAPLASQCAYIFRNCYLNIRSIFTLNLFQTFPSRVFIVCDRSIRARMMNMNIYLRNGCAYAASPQTLNSNHRPTPREPYRQRGCKL